MSPFVMLIWLFCLCSSETILHSQSANYTLTLAESPYVVNSFVIFSSSAHIVIENGVRIIFIENKFISVFGSLDCGCSAHDTINNHTKGLSNPSLFIHILGNESMPTSTGIFINQQSSVSPPVIQFCNTLFDNVQNGIVTTSNQYTPYTVYNCEFRYINNAIHHSTNVINFVFNSYFHEINNVKSAGGVIYDHCLFHSFGKFSFNTAKAIDIAIRNSEIYGDDAQICLNINSIAGDPTYAIYNNTISRCKDGIEIWSPVTIARNTISNCSRYGIFAKDISDTLHISRNIFINNGALDVRLDAVRSVHILYNRFKSDTAAISMDGIACFRCKLSHNHFSDHDVNSVALSSDDYIVSIHHCVDINIAHNVFIYKRNTNGGAIYCEGNEDDRDDTGAVHLVSNVFMNNSIQHLITLQHSTVVEIHNNTMIHCDISGHLLESINSNEIRVSYNDIQRNIAFHTPFINIQNTNYFDFQYNSFQYNALNSSARAAYFIQSEDNTQVNIQRNWFIANTGVRSTTALLYLYKSYSAHIAYNIFDINAVTHDVYLDYLNDRSHTESVIIEYNDFMPGGGTQAVIEIDGDTMRNQHIEIHINWNNFYDPSATHYFIHVHSDSMDIDANHNYWSGWITYTQIAHKVPNICATVHVSNANEEPLPNTSQCSWNMANSCSTITHYTCDSHTTAAPLVAAPSIPPTISPTPQIIIASPPSLVTTTTHIGNTEAVIMESTVALDARTIVHIRNGNDSRFSVLMISISIGCAVVCLVSCEIIWCIRKRREKESMIHSPSQHRFTFSDESYKVNFNDIALHSVRNVFPPPPSIPYMMTETVSRSGLVLMDDLKQEEEEDLAALTEEEEVGVEGDAAPCMIAMKRGRYLVKEDTISCGFGECDNELIESEEEVYDVLGIKIAHDEFIIGSLPKVTQVLKAGLGEGEPFVDDDDGNNDDDEAVIRQSVDEMSTTGL